MQNISALKSLSELASAECVALLSHGGKDLVRRIGMDIVRGVVLDVFVGKNIRDSTETLTRRRIAALNLEMVEMFLRGAGSYEGFVAELPRLARRMLKKVRLSKDERWIAQWCLGLNDKAYQNVLRDSPDALDEYVKQYAKVCEEVVSGYRRMRGDISGRMKLGSGIECEVDLLFLTYLLNTVGAQTLAIRGSEKSTYGKLFEKLILGSLLEILGFTFVGSEPSGRNKKVFWLSSTKGKRQSDATLIYKPGYGIRFDIGFIGRGNSEISLDKVSRFTRELEMGREKYYIKTIVLVDRIGEGSGIQELARRIDGMIIQMSATLWPQEVAQVLNDMLGHEHPLLSMSSSEAQEFLGEAIQGVDLEKYL